MHSDDIFVLEKLALWRIESARLCRMRGRPRRVSSNRNAKIDTGRANRVGYAA